MSIKPTESYRTAAKINVSAFGRKKKVVFQYPKMKVKAIYWPSAAPCPNALERRTRDHGPFHPRERQTEYPTDSEVVEDLLDAPAQVRIG